MALDPPSRFGEIGQRTVSRHQSHSWPKSLGPESNSLSVVFASDRGYIPHLATAVTSLLENNRRLVDRVFVITQAAETPEFETFKADIFARYHIAVEPCEADFGEMDGLYVSGHVSLATYNRFLIGNLLPSDVELVLYLDSDLIVVGDLSPLSLGLAGGLSKETVVVGAVSRDEPDHLIRFGHSGLDYFNAGVLLVNLVEWRKRKVVDQLFSTARELFGELHLWDQDVLNLVLESNWSPLPGSFNETSLTDRQSDARVVHFVGGSKPWMWGSRHPYRKDYDYYRSLTPFWPYRRSGLSAFLRKKLIPRPLQRPSRLLRRFIRRLRRAVGKILGR